VLQLLYELAPHVVYVKPLEVMSQVASTGFRRSRLCLRRSLSSVAPLHGCLPGSSERSQLCATPSTSQPGFAPVNLIARVAAAVLAISRPSLKFLFVGQIGLSPCLERQGMIFTVQSYAARRTGETRKKLESKLPDQLIPIGWSESHCQLRRRESLTLPSESLNL
jgi:hypothetical protein